MTPLRPLSAAVPFFELRRQTATIYDEIRAAIDDVCSSGRFILGAACERLETAIAELCGVAHAVSCASGSDALLLALMALGIGTDDEVVLPTFTFFAPAGAVARLGARPVFVDIEPGTFTLDPARVARVITNRTKAIIPVHLFGQCAEIRPLSELAEKFGLAIVEDAAQAIGATYANAVAGSLGNIGCLSFFPTKNLGCFGDGGMLTTSSSAVADRLRMLRAHGMTARYHHESIGINSRLDTLQAAILEVKLRHLSEWTEQRSANARRYSELFAQRGLDIWLKLPTAGPDRSHVWNQYVVRVEGNQRDSLRQHLTAQNIHTEVYYPEPLHRQPCFADLPWTASDFVEAERCAAECLALPIFPELMAEEQVAVVDGISSFLENPSTRS